ncbi:MAG: cation diffusion facilitator family transporter [Promethearchaeota archaeon]
MDVKIKYGFIALWIIIFQTILKSMGILLTGSLSFLSESVDTFVDIFFVSLTLYSVRTSLKPADYEHMYGHGKTDPIGALIQGVVLIILYIFILNNAIQVILSGTYSISSPEIGLQIIIISFLINMVFSRILIWKGKKNKSLSLEIQGLNLFQDSLRAVVVVISFIFSLFEIYFLDFIFSIILSLWIIYGALKLIKKGIKELTDVNPINQIIIEQLRENIFYLDHVNGVEDIKVRASGNILFLEVRLSVEDHISVIHANEITKSIRSISKELIPFYNIECIIEMNPLGGEKSVSENLINLIYSIYSDYVNILNIKDVNVFSIENELYLSMILIVDNSLTLNEAHEICTNFENEIKNQATYLSRIITHIEGVKRLEAITPKELSCYPVDQKRMNEIQNQVENVLRNYKKVKGYHGLEFWTAIDHCVLELHVFFEGNLNISEVHEFITDIEKDIKTTLKIANLKDIILHSEPLKGRTDGIIF